MSTVHVKEKWEEKENPLNGCITLSNSVDVWYGDDRGYATQAEAMEAAEKICAALNEEKTSLTPLAERRLQVASLLSVDAANFTAEVPLELMGEPAPKRPNNSVANIKYWATLEAKYRLILADALIAESKKSEA